MYEYKCCSRHLSVSYQENKPEQVRLPASLGALRIREMKTAMFSAVISRCKALWKQQIPLSLPLHTTLKQRKKVIQNYVRISRKA